MADAFKPPPYRAGDLQTFVQKRFQPWAQKRKELVEDAKHSYEKVDGVEPLVPESRIASAAGVAKLMRAFVGDFDGIPAVNAWLTRNQAYRTERDMARLRDVRRHFVRSAFEICVWRGQNFQIENDDTRYCAAQLKALEP